MTANGGTEPEVIDLTAISDTSESGDGSGTESGSISENESGASEIEIHLNEETRSQLKQAINTVTAARLRQVLINLIETEQAVEIALTRELVTLHRETHSVVPRWETCQNCEEEFDINTRRDETECEFHPGELEVDEDSFDDWDDDVHGPKDTEKNRYDFPENFIWTCCEGNGANTGCVQGEHQHGVPRKRRRL